MGACRHGWLDRGVQLRRGLSAAARNGKRTRHFVDKKRVSLVGGCGGNGCYSHETLGPGKKRANGGDAGKGGNVIFRTNPALRSLTIGRHHFRGHDGSHGGRNKMNGKNGEDLYIEVPLGTVAKEIWKGDDEDGNTVEKITMEVDMDMEGAAFVGAHGGNGGRGNWRMVSSESSAKRFFQRSLEEEVEVESDALSEFDFENPEDRQAFSFLLDDEGKVVESGPAHRGQGDPGEQRFYELELKLIADVGLVGYPNAGKSTLLGALSRAKPKVAPYPFTTLHPYLGTVEFADGYNFTVADTPGLIDGAHDNKGLGHEFLRHVERNRILAFVIDVSNSDHTGIEAGKALLALERELNLYAPGLGDRDAIILANKLDAIGNDEERQAQSESLLAASKGRPIFPISAKESYGLDRVVTHLRTMLTKED